MKKILMSLVLCITLLGGLVGCTSNPPNNSENNIISYVDPTTGEVSLTTEYNFKLGVNQLLTIACAEIYKLDLDTSDQEYANCYVYLIAYQDILSGVEMEDENFKEAVLDVIDDLIAIWNMKVDAKEKGSSKLIKKANKAYEIVDEKVTDIINNY